MEGLWKNIGELYFIFKSNYGEYSPSFYETVRLLFSLRIVYIYIICNALNIRIYVIKKEKSAKLNECTVNESKKKCMTSYQEK